MQKVLRLGGHLEELGVERTHSTRSLNNIDNGLFLYIAARTHHRSNTHSC